MDKLNFYQQGARSFAQSKYWDNKGNILMGKNIDIWSDEQAIKASIKSKYKQDIGLVDSSWTYNIRKGSDDIYSEINAENGYLNFEEEYNKLNIQTARVRGNFNKHEFWEVKKLFMSHRRRWGYSTATIFTDKLVATCYNWYHYPTLKATSNGCEIEQRGRNIFIKNATAKRFSVWLDPQIDWYAVGSIKIWQSSDSKAKITKISNFSPMLRYEEESDNWNIESVRNTNISLISNWSIENEVKYSGLHLYRGWGGNNCLSISFERGENSEIAIWLELQPISYIFQPLVPASKRGFIKNSEDEIVVTHNERISIFSYHKEWSPKTVNERQRSVMLLKEMSEIFIQDWADFVFLVSMGENRVLGVNKVDNSEIILLSPDGEQLSKKQLQGIKLQAWCVNDGIVYFLYQEGYEWWLGMFNGAEIIKSFIIEKYKYAVLAVKNREPYPSWTHNREEEWSKKMIIHRGRIYIQNMTRTKIFCRNQGTWAMIYQGKPIWELILYDGNLLFSEWGRMRRIGELNETSKQYLWEWEVVYPVIITNYQLEKEPWKVSLGYRLPSTKTALEVWCAVNETCFWTIKCEDFNAEVGEKFFIYGTAKEKIPQLEYIESNGNEHTFMLLEDAELIETRKRDSFSKGVVSIVSVKTDRRWEILHIHHFRKVAEIKVPDGKWHKESQHTIVQINNYLNAPNIHTLQLMVRGKGTEDVMPTLYSINLYTEQRDRW